MELIRKFYAANASGGGPSQEDLDNAERLNDTFARLKETLQSVGSAFRTQLTDQIENFDRIGKRAATQTIRSLEGELKRAAVGVEKTRKAQEGIDKSLMSSKKIQDRINATKSRQSTLESLILELERQGVVLSVEQQGFYDTAINALNEQLQIEEGLLEVAQRRERAVGRIGDLFKGLTKIPILGNLIDAQDVLRQIEKSAEKTGSRWAAFGAGMVAVFKSIGRTLTDPIAIITGIFGLLKKIVKLVIEFNAQTFEISKNLGVSVDKAKELQRQFIQISTDSRNTGLRFSEISKTFNELTESMGFLVPQSKEFTETAALLQKRLGISAEGMKGLALQASISGKSLMGVYTTIEKSRQIEGARNKLQLTQRQLIEAIAKTSSAVLINFKGNVTALSNAITRAAKLGTTLETVNKQGEALLDFESSIGKEFEAQLLTGREINMTKAREYALMGQTANLMEELNKQGATYDQFMNQNVIARKAEADLVGLSVEEYAKILLQQKQAVALGAEQGESLQQAYNNLVQEGKTREEIAGLITKSAEEDLYRSSINDKFQNALEKLKMTLGSILEGPLGGIIDKFAAFVSNAAEMNKLGERLKGLFEGIGSVLSRLPSMMGAAVTVAKVLASLTIARAVASILAASSMGGPAGLIAGGIAAAGAYTWLSSMIGGAAGGEAPTISAPGAETMTTPVNPGLAYAQTTKPSTATGPGTGLTPVYNVITYVGTENWSRQSRTAIQEDHGTTIR